VYKISAVRPADLSRPCERYFSELLICQERLERIFPGIRENSTVTINPGRETNTMPAIEILPNLFWVGAVDWNARQFHGPSYSIHRGTTYNSYLIRDEKLTLVDGVHAPFTDELVANIREIADPAAIDHVVVNHIENDHSGALPALMGLAPRAGVYCTQMARDGLQRMYPGQWDFHIVKTGDTLNIGRCTLTFLEAPMLHWPDTMFTYVAEHALLLPNDAFGQHLASAARFDDEVDQSVLMDEAAKYYGNILLPFSGLVLRKLAEVAAMNIPVRMIAPSHGVIWRADPGKILTAYRNWAESSGGAAVGIVYDTMYNSTEKMAYAVLNGVMASGAAVRFFGRLSQHDHSDLIRDLLSVKALIVGSPTLHRDYLPTMATLLDEIRNLKPRNKIGAAFGSYGWSGEGVRNLETRLREAGIDLVEQGIRVKYQATEQELAQCFALGRKIGEMVNK
jgi:flavorubredoxin